MTAKTLPIAIALLLPIIATAAAPDSSESRPNILFIAVDDLRPELGCYGTEGILSPNIDALAARGTVFDRAYCQQAVCSPSRTSLLTGCRPDTTKVYDLQTHFRKNLPNVVTLPQHFKNHGYTTRSMGKIFHGGLDDKPSWSEPPAKVGRSMYALEENKKLVAQKRAAIKGKTFRTPSSRYNAMAGPAYECTDVPDNTYTDGAIADEAIASLRKVKGKPFFLAVGFLKPHLPFIAPKKYWDLYDRDKIPMARNPFAPKDAPKMALTNWGELRAYHDIPSVGPLTDDEARTLKHGYYACVSYIDAQLGRVLKELDRLELRDNTVVILWGDHGWKLGEHAMWCKHTNFEIDARVPMICAAPNQKDGGSHTRSLVEFVDIYPTLCELADLPLPKHVEGDSFAALLDNPKLPGSPTAISQYPRGNVMGYSMRTDRYRLTLWQKREAPHETMAVELYDHEKDPDENANVAHAPDNAALVEELTAQLEAEVREPAVRTMKYTSRSSEAAKQWQETLREKLFQRMKMEDLVAEANQIDLKPRTLSTTDHEKYTEREMEIQSTSDRAIRVVVTLPKDTPLPCPAVVCIHGHGGNRRTTHDDPRGIYKRFAAELAARGYVTISADVGQHEVYEKDRTLMGERLWDLMRCVDHLESMPEVDPDRIGCGGLSLGGEMAMWLGAMDTRMAATVSAGFLTRMDQMEHNHCMCWKFAGLRELVDFADLYAMTAPRPLVCQNGEKEPPSQFPPSIAREAMKEIRLAYTDMGQPENVQLHVHPGAHEIALPNLLEFFERHLSKP
jgi:iduronate 2-sulfatase